MGRNEQIVEASWRYAKAYQKPFVDGAMWADSHPRWISVEDELPEENKFVLTYNGTSINLLMLAGNGGWYDHSVAEHLIVTHWMPLPQPPKKGGEQ